MKRILMLLFLGCGLIAQAQQDTTRKAMQPGDTVKMSLQECIDYSFKNSYTIKNATIDEELSKSKVGEVRAIGLPQISATIAAQHNLRLRDIYAQSSSQSPFSQRNPDGSLVIPEGKLFKIPNIFQLPNSLDASLTISQIIFSGSYIVGLQAAKTYRELSSKSSQLSKIQVADNVTKAYYMVLINLQRMYLFDANILRVSSLLDETRKLQSAGFVEKTDAMRLEVTLNNLITERDKFINIMILSNAMLKYQMGMPLDNNLTLMDKLEDLKLDTSAVSSQKIDYNNRVEYKQLKVSKKLQELDLKNNRWFAMPSLVASANLGTFTSNTDLNFFSSKNFGPDYKNWNWGNKGIWSKYGLIQVALQIPLFGGFSNRYKVQQSQLNLQKTENSIKSFEQSVDLQVQSAAITLKNNLQTMQSQKRNMQLAQEVASATQKKYKAGTTSNLEVVTAEKELKEAQINYYNAFYDALVNKIEYDQAIGNYTYK